MINPQQRLFVDYYLETLNATEAYARAYPSQTNPDYLRTSASILMHKPHIIQLISEQQERLRIQSNITKDKLLARLDRIANEAAANQDHKNEIQAIKLMNQMLGYNAPLETVNTHMIMQEQPLFGPVMEITVNEAKAIDGPAYQGALIPILPDMFDDGNLKELRYDG
jgi:hypothetical protein